MTTPGYRFLDRRQMLAVCLAYVDREPAGHLREMNFFRRQLPTGNSARDKMTKSFRRSRRSDRRRYFRRLREALLVAGDACLEHRPGTAVRVLASTVLTLHDAQSIVYDGVYPPPLYIQTRRTITIRAQHHIQPGDLVGLTSTGDGVHRTVSPGQVVGRVVAVTHEPEMSHVTVEIQPPQRTDWGESILARVRNNRPQTVRATFPQSFDASGPDAGWIGHECGVYHNEATHRAQAFLCTAPYHAPVGVCEGVSPTRSPVYPYSRIALRLTNRQLTRFDTREAVALGWRSSGPVANRDLLDELSRDVLVYGTAYVDEWNQRVAPEMVITHSDVDDIRRVAERMHAAAAGDPVMRMAMGWDRPAHTAESRADEQRFYDRIAVHQGEMRVRVQADVARMLVELESLPNGPLPDDRVDALLYAHDNASVPPRYAMTQLAPLAFKPREPLAEERIEMRGRYGTGVVYTPITLVGLDVDDPPSPNCRCVADPVIDDGARDASESADGDDDA